MNMNKAIHKCKDDLTLQGINCCTAPMTVISDAVSDWLDRQPNLSDEDREDMLFFLPLALVG